MGVADQPDPLLLRVQPRFGLVDREHVLPDRVAGGGVEEADAGPRRRRLEPAQELDGGGADVLPRPLDRGRRGLREGGDVEVAEHRQVVVAGEADGAALLDQVGAGVGLGAVADDVAEAPDLLDAGRVDRREDGLERGLVGVNIADDGGTQAASVPVPSLRSIRLARDRHRFDRRAARRRRPGGAGPARRRAHRAGALARPPAEAGAGRLQLQRGDAAGGAAGRQPARRRRAPAGGAGARPRRLRQPRADRGRRPRLRQLLPLRRLVPAGAGRPGRRRRGARPSADREPGAGPGRVRLRQPDRAAARRRRSPRRLRRRPGAAAGGGRPRGRARVLRQRRRRPDHPLRRLDRRPHGRHRACPRAATKASTSPSSAPGSPPRASTRPIARRSAGAGSS